MRMCRRSLVLVWPVLLVLVFTSGEVVGASRHHRLRHRHDLGSLSPTRRGGHDYRALDSSWPDQEADYEDAFEDAEDEDYEVDRAYRERLYQPNRRSRNHHSRFEPYYPARHHQAPPSYGWHRHGNGVVSGYSAEDAEPERRRWHHESRGQRQRQARERYPEERRSTSGFAHPSRGHEDAPMDLPEVDLDWDRISRRWRADDEVEDDPQDYRPKAWRRHRLHQDSRKLDRKSSASSSSSSRVGDEERSERRWKTSTSRVPKRTGRFDETGSDPPEETGNENAWSAKRTRNLIERGNEWRKDSEDYRDYDEVVANEEEDEAKSLDNRRKDEKKGEDKEEDEDAEEADDIWNESEDDLDTFDATNYYKTEDEPPYKTFDDIIKSLTSDDPTTLKPTIRRDYRNVGIEKYLKRDAYGNIYDSRNATPPRLGHEASSRLNLPSNKLRYHVDKPNPPMYSAPNGGKQIINADIGPSKSRKDSNEKKRGNNDEAFTRTRSLEQDYDEEYENDEKDEDARKITRQYVNEMQADVDNTEYADEENETETEDETSAPVVTTPPTTTTTSTPMTTTTTTQKPLITARGPSTNYERRDSRSHFTSSDAQSNGLQQQPLHNVHKWSNARDSSKDNKVRGQQNKNGKAEIKEALQHAIKVSREGSCQWPRARVIPVRDVYPSPSTTYIPHCAILHRCSDDTGCCRSEALTCVPKVSHRVELYFYTTSIGGGSVVEKLSFYNHTECECKERDEYGTAIDKVASEPRITRHHAQAISPPQNIKRPPQRKPCKCPSDFTPRITPEGECQCHCFENHQNCIRTRRGKGYFSLRDRLCIQNDECGTPVCEFGEYMRRQGKCPRKKDRFDAIANHPVNINLHHRFRN